MTWDGKLHQRTGLLDYTKVIKFLKLLSINTTIKNSVYNSRYGTMRKEDEETKRGLNHEELNRCGRTKENLKHWDK